MALRGKVARFRGLKATLNAASTANGSGRGSAYVGLKAYAPSAINGPLLTPGRYVGAGISPYVYGPVTLPNGYAFKGWSNGLPLGGYGPLL